MSIIFSIFKEKNTMENFKQIPGYENYGISPAGEVKNLKTGKILKQQPMMYPNKIYYRVGVYNESGLKYFKVHQLMAIVYLNHVPHGSKIVVDHINGDSTNNRLENLQLIQHRINVAKDRYRNLPTGVYFYKYKNTYTSQIFINGKSEYLGMFNTIEEASNTYQQKIKQINI